MALVWSLALTTLSYFTAQTIATSSIEHPTRIISPSDHTTIQKNIWHNTNDNIFVSSGRFDTTPTTFSPRITDNSLTQKALTFIGLLTLFHGSTDTQNAYKNIALFIITTMSSYRMTYGVTLEPTSAPTTAAPTGQGCSANYAFVEVQTASGLFKETATSLRVDFPPYAYSNNIINRRLVLFGDGADMTPTHNNPCDHTTWTDAPADYNGRIVMIDYSDYFVEAFCSIQQWTLNLEEFADVKAVLVANNKDLYHVWSIEGDTSLTDPTIPTRMISQVSAQNIRNEMNRTGENVYVDIDCFDTAAPTVICVLDETNYGINVALDGEYQQQSNIKVNDHPVWLKEGMSLLWADMFIWLYVDHSATNSDPWRWVIGTNYDDSSTIFAQCVLTWSSEYIDDPTQCGKNWYTSSGELIGNLTSNDGICDLADSYVCADSGSAFFDNYFAGRYRQVHDGVSLWFANDVGSTGELTGDAFVGINFVNQTFYAGWAFVFAYASSGSIYAFCPIYSGQNLLEPWNCNQDWYTMAQFDWGLSWINDPLMDIDQCQHPNATNITVATDIVYPKALCLMDPYYAYSHHQTFYGIYLLDNSTVYNNRYIYRNQRLLGDADEWDILWYETKDSWAINNGVPGETYLTNFGGICRDDVDTPDLCTSSWEFYEGVESEINANIVMYAIDSTNEEDCMSQPTDPGITYVEEITLCFHDDTGLIYPDTYSNPFTGKWKIDSSTLYRNRHYWYLLDETTGSIKYFMYYEDDWRYWVIDSYFYTHQDQFDLICLRYDEFEPFNCASWYSQVSGFTMTMDADCTLNPTPFPTTPEPSVSPTQHPIGECSAQNHYVGLKSVANLWADQVLTSSPMNFPPFSSETFYHEKVVLFEDGVPATNWTVYEHNPCNYGTWKQNHSYYMGNVVLIPYDDWFGGVSCTVQQWVWMLESYGAIGVLVANNVDTDHVYALSGDDTLYTSIPTRMVSQIAGMVMTIAISDYADEVYVDFGCFDHAERPSVICINDYNNIGNYVYLDGEYQRQLYEINDHPYYLKLGHYGLWDHMYLWLEIDRSVSGDAEWTWVIGTDFTDVNSVIAECRVNGTHIDHPGLCGNNWWVGDTLRATIESSNSTCQLGDNYVCLTSTSGVYFGYWFDGQYRQIHDGVSLWLMHSEDDIDSYITVGQMSNVPGHSGNPWAFAVVLNQSDIYAYCVIGDGSYPSDEEMMKPYECTDDWWVFGYDGYNNPTWYIDLGFDIDECTHSNITTTAATINYPQTLCLSDPTNAYSHYQGHYGVYRLDTSTSFDGRYVYYNQRLKDESLNWYIMWYEEKDAWVLNEYVPSISIVQEQDGICRDDVLTPDECSECWEFYEGFEWQNDCNIELTTMSTTDEVDCMPILAETDTTFDGLTYELSLCFDDSYYSDWDNIYSGKFYTHDYLTYNGRNYWYRTDEYANKILYIFYDEIKRFWVIDTTLGSTDYSQWHWYCLQWDKFEPFDCDTWYQTNWNWTMSMTTCAPSVSPTPAPTAYPTMNCNARNAFVYADWTHDGILPRVLTSEYTNYAPFVYDTLINVELVLFENGRNMTEESSNPCSLSTLVEDYWFYADKIVMIEYNELCNMERQALYMEFMGAVGVLIHNNDMTHTVSDHVFALSGDDTLGAMPTIPSRMISEYAGILLKVVMEEDETVFISFDCYDDTIEYPSIICLVDKSVNGMRVYLDGEYQRQASWFTVNDHPVWLKTGYTGLWKEIYMWLMVENEDGDDAWKWVIGTKYWDESTIIAVCDISGEHIDHPALCGQNWYVNGTLEKTITTSNNTCSLGDNYVCVEAAPEGLFDWYFSGQYRQIHEGVSVWTHENAYTDMYITIGTMVMAGAGIIDPTWVFSFVINQTAVWAFCVIGDGSEPSDIEKLSPYDCTEDWYVMEFDYTTYQYYWTIDYAFDVDECTHPNITTTAPTIDYPKYLCLNDETDTSSHYQSHYGVYVLDNETTFDGRNVYYNQRLKDNLHDWYILFYEEKDAWVINEYVPNQWFTTVVRDHEGICREESLTPDQCTECWEFYDRSGLRATPNCNVKLTVIDNPEEGNCVELPVMTKDMKDMRKQQFLAFDKPFDALSGKWVLAEDTYNDRAYWYKVNTDSSVRRLLQSDESEWYMFYDEMWRYWAIDSKLGGSLNDVLQAEGDLFCLDWRSFEPWNCSTWYTSDNQTAITMNLVYTGSPTTEPTNTPSTEPTITYISEAGTGTGHAKKANAFTILGWCIAVFVSLGCCMLYFCNKRRNKQKYFFERSRSASGHAVVAQGSGSPDMGIDVNMVQMYGSPSNGGTGSNGNNGENNNNTPISDDGSQRNLREGSELDRYDGVDGLGMTGGNGARKSKSKSSDENPEAPLNANDEQYIMKSRLSTTVGGDDDDELFNPNLNESGDDVADDEIKPKAWVKFSE